MLFEMQQFSAELEKTLTELDFLHLHMSCYSNSKT